MESISITYEGLPPFKANPGPNAKAARERQEGFKKAAEKAIKDWRGTRHEEIFPWNPMTTFVRLEIVYERGRGENDAANIIGGISDALQNVIYANDKQVRSIAYSEKAADSSSDKVSVSVSQIAIGAVEDTQTQQGESNLTPPNLRGYPNDWERKIDEAWSKHAPESGRSFAGPQASMDAAEALGVPKLSADKFKTLQGLLDSSLFLTQRWERKANTITKR